MKRALIVLGGDAPSAALLTACVSEASFIVAADRGLEAFARTALLPDLILGDMDSVLPETLSRYEALVPERRLNCVKDDTDGEAALDAALQNGCREIVFLGALGGRLDHALANVMLLVKAHQNGAQARILDESVCIERVSGRAELRGCQGDTVSFLPLGRAEGVTLEGFFYPLREYTMTSDNSLGISNVVSEETAVASVQTGDLIMFHYYREPMIRGEQ